METNKYDTLLKAMETGNLTQAAEALGYTQSAVSRIVADLETAWGLTLLSRSRAGVAPTAEGKALLPYLRAVCNAQRQLEEEVADLRGLILGTIRIGTFSSVSLRWLPGIMKSFLVRHPGIRFQVRSTMEYAEIEDWVLAGEVDCGFLALPAIRPLETVFLHRDRILAVLPPDHPLATAQRFPIARFAQEPYLQLDEDRDREYQDLFVRLGVKPKARYSVNDDHAIMAMAANGLGVGILSELMLRNNPYDVVTKPLDVPQHRDIGLAVRSFEAASPVTARFIDHVREWVAQYSGGL